MKRTLLYVALAMFSTYSFSQITVGQTSDFQSGTQGWKHGQPSSTNQPVQITMGGPGGMTDAFLRTTNSGSGGPGGRHAFINDDANWIGDFTAAGVLSINFDVQNPGSRDVSLRVGLQSNFNSRWAVSTVPTVIPAGSGWVNVTMNVDAASLTSAGNPAEMVSDILTDVTIIKIYSNDGSTSPLYAGELTSLVSDYDNITALSTLSAPDFSRQSNEFSISPNPARS
ncbi:MAG: hypothetical protein AAF901_08440, partial [Bacteroidota bacterium]